jgi:hypothetical protein
MLSLNVFTLVSETVLSRLRGQAENAQGDSKMTRQHEVRHVSETLSPEDGRSITRNQCCN